MSYQRLTMAQALVQALSVQWTHFEGRRQRLFAGVWAIFGHGNVAGLGEALQSAKGALPTLRAHNEQAMAHAAIAFSKACRRRRIMACTTSIGPGATNLTTAAAVAHVNRLPVLLLPGDVFASRRPDPVLQQVEDFGDGLISANDCLRPVSRYFDRITRPEQIIPALERALQVLTDPAECGPVTLALCQDVQTEAYDYPSEFFREREWVLRRQPPAETDLTNATRAIRQAKQPIIVCGGGVLYSGAEESLTQFAERHGVPVVETQAGKSALPTHHSLNLGAVGVTGTAAANTLMEQADVILAVGTRLQDFTTGSAQLIRKSGRPLIGLNVQPFDAYKFDALPLIADADVGLRQLSNTLSDWTSAPAWREQAANQLRKWNQTADTFTDGHQPSGARAATTDTSNRQPSDAQVIGAVQRSSQPTDIVVCAAGGLPGELHKLWRAGAPGGYHLEYGYSCMGYEIAGGLGVKLAQPSREVFVMVGDGSYLMMNSEIATSIQLNRKLIILLLDNRGFGCIERLQNATGNASFNNLLTDSAPRVDFPAHARSLGAHASLLDSLDQLPAAIAAARQADRTSVLVIQTDPRKSTTAGGTWWDVPVPEVSQRPEVQQAREAYTTRRNR
jgi:3D-(3,5/4)-trihydroxycyclohexane-1,2-dione acylhydrolase (decyclizing)